MVFLAVAACAVALVGCKNADSQVIGKWNSANSVSVTFQADKTYAQSGPISVTGKWSVADKKVTMTVETVAGKSADELIKQMAKMGMSADMVAKAKEQMKGVVFNLAEDGKTMAMASPPAGTDAKLTTLTKADSK